MKITKIRKKLIDLDYKTFKNIFYYLKKYNKDYNLMSKDEILKFYDKVKKQNIKLSEVLNEEEIISSIKQNDFEHYTNMIINIRDSVIKRYNIGSLAQLYYRLKQITLSLYDYDTEKCINILNRIFDFYFVPKNKNINLENVEGNQYDISKR